MKVRSRKAAFTGVIAAAAFAASGTSAFAATAMPTAPARASATWPGSGTVRVCTNSRMTANCVTIKASEPTKAIPDSTTPGDCSNGNLFHLYFIGVRGVPADFCLGGAGDYASFSPGFVTYGFCGGNNHGYLKGTNASGVPVTQDYGPGSSIYSFNNPKFGGSLTVTHLHITGWNGSQNCPAP
jgi:hypothetical protein